MLLPAPASGHDAPPQRSSSAWPATVARGRHADLARTPVRLSGEALDRCGFCGGADGPFTRVEGVVTVLMCPGCRADRARGRGPYPGLTDDELQAGLDLLPAWAPEQKAAANRQVIAVMRGRLDRSEPVARMDGPLGLAWRQRQAETAEHLIQQRQDR
jgi:hypothetical protein